MEQAQFSFHHCPELGDIRSLLSNAQEGDTVYLPNGVYGMHPSQGMVFSCSLSNSEPSDLLSAGILPEGKSSLIIDGQGSTLLCHGQMDAFALLNCQKITLQNFIIDWDIPLTAEGTITEAANDHIDLTVDPQKYPFHITDGCLWFDGGDWSQKLHFWGHTEFESKKD